VKCVQILIKLSMSLRLLYAVKDCVAAGKLGNNENRIMGNGLCKVFSLKDRLASGGLSFHPRKTLPILKEICLNQQVNSNLGAPSTPLSPFPHLHPTRLCSIIVFIDF
jgi:hypothetical protein